MENNQQEILEQLLGIEMNLEFKYFKNIEFNDSKLERKFLNDYQHKKSLQKVFSDLILAGGYITCLSFSKLVFRTKLFFILFLIFVLINIIILILTYVIKTKKFLQVLEHILIFLFSLQINLKIILLSFEERSINIEYSNFGIQEEFHIELLRAIIYEFIFTNFLLLFKLERKFLYHIFYCLFNFIIIIICQVNLKKNYSIYLDGLVSIVYSIIFYYFRKLWEYKIRKVFAEKYKFENLFLYTNDFILGLNGYHLNFKNNYLLCYDDKFYKFLNANLKNPLNQCDLPLFAYRKSFTKLKKKTSFSNNKDKFMKEIEKTKGSSINNQKFDRIKKDKIFNYYLRNFDLKEFNAMTYFLNELKKYEIDQTKYPSDSQKDCNENFNLNQIHSNNYRAFTSNENNVKIDSNDNIKKDKFNEIKNMINCKLNLLDIIKDLFKQKDIKEKNFENIYLGIYSFNSEKYKIKNFESLKIIKNEPDIKLDISIDNNLSIVPNKYNISQNINFDSSLFDDKNLSNNKFSLTKDNKSHFYDSLTPQLSKNSLNYKNEFENLNNSEIEHINYFKKKDSKKNKLRNLIFEKNNLDIEDLFKNHSKNSSRFKQSYKNVVENNDYQNVEIKIFDYEDDPKKNNVDLKGGFDKIVTLALNNKINDLSDYSKNINKVNQNNENYQKELLSSKNDSKNSKNLRNTLENHFNFDSNSSKINFDNSNNLHNHFSTNNGNKLLSPSFEDKSLNIKISQKEDKIEDELRDTKYFDVYFRRIYFSDDNIIYNLILYDVTDLIDSKLKILEENKKKQKVLAKIAHEFKTPLTSIICLISILKDKIDFRFETNNNYNKKRKLKETVISTEYNNQIKVLNQDTINTLDLIQNLSRYVIFLTSDIINYSNPDKLSSTKIDYHKIDFKEISVFCFDILKSLLYCNYTKLKKIKTELIYDETINETNYYSDQVKIKQIILNFISNSVKFTNDGFINLIFKKSIDNNYLKISVKDSGLGIKEEDKKCLFRDFFKNENLKLNSLNNANLGSGLGLAICKNLAEKLNMKIDIDSEYGKGTEISLLIYLEENKNIDNNFPIKTNNTDEIESITKNLKSMNSPVYKTNIKCDANNSDISSINNGLIQNSNHNDISGIKCRYKQFNISYIDSYFKEMEMRNFYCLSKKEIDTSFSKNKTCREFDKNKSCTLNSFKKKLDLEEPLFENKSSNV